MHPCLNPNLQPPPIKLLECTPDASPSRVSRGLKPSGSDSGSGGASYTNKTAC